MVARALPRPLTWEDLAQTPETSDRYEIILGEMVVSAAPKPPHQLVASRLTAIVLPFVEARGLGVFYGSPVDVRLAASTIVEPDGVFVAEARRHIVGPTLVDGAPDLVIEVLSPSTRRRDLVTKAALYASYGVREYWQADLRSRTLRILDLHEGEYRPLPMEGDFIRSRVLDGLVIDVKKLFAGIVN